MYPNQRQQSPPPNAPLHPGGYEQYPLSDTHFSPQPMDRNPGYAADPFDDHHQQGGMGAYHDNAPLLQHQNSDYGDSYPAQSPYGAPSPSPSPHVNIGFPSPGGGIHYGEAPRRVARRYKTGKCSSRTHGIMIGRQDCCESGVWNAGLKMQLHSEKGAIDQW